MAVSGWQLKTPIDAVFFDCDGTLSQIEGIDVLAQNNGIDAAVKILTERAMSQTGMSAALYQKRLALVRPTRAQVNELGAAYYAALTPDVDLVIAILARLGKAVYIISAGIQDGVSNFAKRLGVSESHVLAVPVFFDDEGHYRDYDHHSPMSDQNGKRDVIAAFKKQYPRVVHVGDGMNDVEAAPVVERFIGYGGVHFRENIAAACDFYITTKSLSPILPLCLTADEVTQLLAHEREVYQSGLLAIETNAVLLKNNNNN